MYDRSIMYSRILIVVSLLFLLVFSPSVVSAQNAGVLNEVLVHPSAGGKEWVEFYVADSNALRSYWIDDDTSFTEDSGGSAKKSLESILQGNDDKHFFIELTGSMFNNSEDMVVLFNSEGTIVDQIKYTDGPGYDVTFGRIPNAAGSFYLLESPTRGGPNSGQKPAPTDEPEPTPKPTKATTTVVVSDPQEVNTSTRRSSPTSANTVTNTVRIPTPTRSVSTTPRSSSTSAQVASRGAFPTAILGAKTTAGPTKIPLPSLPVRVQGASSAPALFTILGAGFIIACAVVLFIKKLKAQE